ncbi:thermonuclease family protein [Candidatus Pseudothioglobus singularis]|nr:thermonuclease family protein [Candidatus Pseudothioglobus singularis]
MKKLFLILTLLLISNFSFAGDCPDGSDPIRSVSDDGTYFVFSCGGNNSSNSSSQSSSSSSSSSLSKDSSIVTYEVVFAADVLQELLERVLSKTDFDFSKHKLTSNADNWRCNFIMRRVNYEDSVGGTIESWSSARGAVVISGSKISFAKGSAWEMGGLSTDPSYLQDEVNLKLTHDGHIVGRMAYFIFGVQEGEVPVSPRYVSLTKHKNSKPIDPSNMKKTNAELWIDIEDWAGGIIRIKSCKQTSAPKTNSNQSSSTTKVVATSDNDPTVSNIIEVIQGDRFIVDIAEPHELAGSGVTIFLKDIDAPDAIKSCPKQMELGEKVKDIVAQKLADAQSIKLKNFRKTNKGIRTQVIVDGKDLGEELISKGYASNEYGYWKAYICSSLTAYLSAEQHMWNNDFDKAIFWYERAIVMEPNSTQRGKAEYHLNIAYRNLDDSISAKNHLIESAKQGWSEGEFELGENYLNGWDGFTKDLSEAKYWLKQAYANGEDRAEKVYCSSLTPDKQATCKF